LIFLKEPIIHARIGGYGPITVSLVRSVSPLVGTNVGRVAFKRGAYLRQFVYQFAELPSHRLDRKLVVRAMTGQVNDYEL